MNEAAYAHRVRLRRQAAGFTQRELAELSGVKQPLIAAIERGTRQPTKAVRDALEATLRVRPSQLLHAARQQVASTIEESGGTDARVIGSVAQGTDNPDSDLDLLVTFPPDADIVTLLTLEERLAELLTVPVDIISTGSSGPVLDTALTEAVAL